MLDVAQSIRRLSGAPFVASAVFLPQRVQFLSSLDGGSVELDAAKDTSGYVKIAIENGHL